MSNVGRLRNQNKIQTSLSKKLNGIPIIIDKITGHKK